MGNDHSPDFLMHYAKDKVKYGQFYAQGQVTLEPILPTWPNDTPILRHGLSFNLRDVSGRIYIENHLTFLILNIFAQGLLVSEEMEDFLCF